MQDAIRRAAHGLVLWNDDWWSNSSWPELAGQAVVFHGSLQNAARIRQELLWKPGAYCNVEACECSAWYPRASRWLLHQRWEILPANTLVANPDAALQSIGASDEVFVRPNSPLKPFSGRVLPRNRITLEALDYGFYFDDPTIDVVLTPVREIGREWRFVVVAANVVAGSAYRAEDRVAIVDDPTGPPWEFASDVAASLSPPDQVYAMDICEADGRLWLLELNPFSGADLYGCNADDVIAAVSAMLRSERAI
jgi:hypothetical protein